MCHNSGAATSVGRNSNNNNTRKLKREIFIKMHTILYSATCLEQQQQQQQTQKQYGQRSLWPKRKTPALPFDTHRKKREKEKRVKSHF